MREPTALKDLLKKDFTKQPKNVSREFQMEALRILKGLGITNRKRYSSYFKVVKETPRPLIQQAYSFAVDCPNADRDKMFFWKLHQLKKGIDNK